ncbi:MAG: RtcB family protein, partial [Candidatus Micrarchaeota archaeon]|nr:RtcB family protein [Candidatus Micrarchaeota archaeon]
MDPKEIAPGMYEFAGQNGGLPVRLVAKAHMLKSILSDRTLNQAHNVAQLPGLVEASFVMPDAHEGYGFPIG